ncbi:hypothetical protein FOA52_004802 [Chlamydomonas sp. UWO 241]|nr:hypothetical protein FOA52_004802 [Chlamydomonas sp. UWO 241]
MMARRAASCRPSGFFICAPRKPLEETAAHAGTRHPISGVSMQARRRPSSSVAPMRPMQTLAGYVRPSSRRPRTGRRKAGLFATRAVGTEGSTGTSARQHGRCSCGTVRPGACNTSGATPPEDAARAYDWAAVKLHGADCKKLNFPGQNISEPPTTVGDKRGESKSSRFKGVSWHNSRSAWRVQLQQAQRTQHIGYYTSEEAAARAYDCAAVKLHGPETKRNFPDEIISELPASREDERKEHKASR